MSVEEGDYEDRNPHSKHFEKKLRERSSLREAENSDLNRTTQKNLAFRGLGYAQYEWRAFGQPVWLSDCAFVRA